MKFVCIKTVPNIFTEGKIYSGDKKENGKYHFVGDNSKAYKFLDNLEKYFIEFNSETNVILKCVKSVEINGEEYLTKDKIYIGSIHRLNHYLIKDNFNNWVIIDMIKDKESFIELSLRYEKSNLTPKYDGIRNVPIVDHALLIKNCKGDKEQIDSVNKWLKEWSDFLIKERLKQKEQHKNDLNEIRLEKTIDDQFTSQIKRTRTFDPVDGLTSIEIIYPKDITQKEMQEYIKRFNSEKAMEELKEIRNELIEIHKQNSQLNYRLEKLIQKTKNILNDRF